MARRPRSGRFLLVVVDLGELRVNHVFLFLTRSCVIAAGRVLRFLLLLVHGLAKLHRCLRQRVGLGLDRRRIVALERFLQIGNRILNRGAICIADFRAML